MLKTWYNFGKNKEKGFTLIELLIVVAIIAILAAIAIPQFGAYRRRGYNAASTSDLRTIRTTQEAMQADFQDYGTSHTSIATQGIEMTVTLYLNGAVSTTAQQSISLSPKVEAAVLATTPAIGVANTNYSAVTAHTAGDNYYGADANTTSLYRKGFVTGTVGLPNCASPGGVSLSATASDFDSSWTTM